MAWINRYYFFKKNKLQATFRRWFASCYKAITSIYKFGDFLIFLTNHAFSHIIMSRILFTVIIFTFFAQLTQAQGVRKYSNEFLSVGIGARALGMGNVQSAFSNDVTAAYWNPAGLQQLNNTQVGLMHAEWFAGIAKYDYVGIALPIADRRRSIGISAIRFAVDDIPNTLFLIDPDGSINYDNVTSFSAADYAFLLTYAQKMGKFRVGANAKVIHRIVGKFANSWGMGVDLGIQYQNKNFSMGLCLKDFPVTYNTWGFNFTEDEKEILDLTNNVIPINSVELTGGRGILGFAYNLPLGKKAALLTSADFDITTDGRRNTLIKTDFASIDPHVGIEFNYNQVVFLRAGINNIQQVTDDEDKKYTALQPNAGLGFKIRDSKTQRIPEIGIDYAFTGLNNLGSENKLYSHVFSLTVSLNNKKNTTLPVSEAQPKPEKKVKAKNRKDKTPEEQPQ